MQNSPVSQQKKSDFARVLALFKANRHTDVMKYAVSLLQKYPRDPFLYNIMGITQSAHKSFDKAEKLFGKAVKLNPNNLDYLRNLANVERNLGKLHLAEKTLGKALKLDAGYAAGWNSLGLVYRAMEDDKKAISAFRKAVKTAPHPIEAAANYLLECNRYGDVKQLQTALHDFEEITPDHSITALCRGFLQEKTKEYQAAGKTLSSVSFGKDSSFPNGYLELFRVNRLAKINDRLGNFTEAYGQFTESNALLAARSPAGSIRPEVFHQRVQARIEYFSGDAVKSWNVVETSEETPVFMIGFPRSGTTLLDSFLNGHKDISVTEELPMVKNAIQKGLGAKRTDDIEHLTTVSDAVVKSCAADYLQAMRKTAGNAPVMIDRLPFNLIHVGEILRVFPKAKFIMVVRDPADAVLSAFMQTFRVDGSLSTMTSAVSAAKAFDDFMQLWVVYQKAFDLQFITCTYENLINDTETTLKSVVDFLGLEWDANTLDHQHTALERQRINTASYDQVVQPIYTDAIGRWKNYATLMPEAVEIVQPWRTYFGYAKA